MVANFIVNLRLVFYGREEDANSQPSVIKFASHVVGNMGAPLSLPAETVEENQKVIITSIPLAVGLVRIETE